jgi:uridine kinase
MMKLHANRLVVSICGASGVGKSYLSKALVAALGEDESVRIPGDYYLCPATTSLERYFAAPHQYDWSLLARDLASPLGSTIAIPDFDFEQFQRRIGQGDKRIVLRRIAILDTLYPYPNAHIRILLRAPERLRAARVKMRDTIWHTNVAGRWQHLELSAAFLDQISDKYAAVLSGDDSVNKNVAAIRTLIIASSK